MMNAMRAHIQNGIRKLGFNLEKYTPFELEIYNRSFGTEAVYRRQFYNIGAGDFYHPAWSNVDKPTDYYSNMQQTRGVDVPWDLMALSPLPIEDSSAHLVFTSHTIEHVSNEAVDNLFREAYRILRQGGVFRIVGPDADIAYRAYLRKDSDYFRLFECGARQSVQQSLLQVVASATKTGAANSSSTGKVESISFSDSDVDEIFRNSKYTDALDRITSECSLEDQGSNPGWHMNWWNVDKVVSFLSNAGFTAIYRSGYLQSQSRVLRNRWLFDTRPAISFYVEAVK